MTTAYELRQQTQNAIDKQYWTIDEYIKKIEDEMKAAADKKLTNLCWMPHYSCPDAKPDTERTKQIIKCLQKKGLIVEESIIYDGVINIYWNKKPSQTCIIL